MPSRRKPTPTPTPVPSIRLGYGASTTGGEGGTLLTPTSANSMIDALRASYPRIIRPDFDGDLGGQSVSVHNGNLTIDGTGWAGVLHRYSLVIRASNVRILQMRMRPGDQIDDVGEGDALTFLPPVGETLSHLSLEQCSLMWAPDVILAILNRCTDVTVQHSILGPSLYQSANPTSPNGYGPNVAPTAAGGDAERVSIIRNLIPMNKRRNLRAHGAIDYEAVNNAIFDHGDRAWHGNVRRGAVVGTMVRKGPETTTNELGRTETNADYPQPFLNALWWHDNIGIGFAGTTNFAAGTLRSSGTLHNVTAAPASSTLYEEVVKAAGPTQVDAIDSLIKQHALNGTSDGYYNGVGFSGPHPSW